jgi:hypothetical protein
MKASLIAGALALSSLGLSSPAAAQVSFGVQFGTGYDYGYPNYGYDYRRPYYGNYYRARNCRYVTRVRHDRWGYPRYVRTLQCPRGYPGYGYGYGWGY